MNRALFAALLVPLLLWGSLAHAQRPEPTEERGQYRVTMLRAAPGQWVAMKALIEGQGEAGAPDARGRMATYRVRHSQGASWDFMLIQPIEGLERYFGAEVQAREAPFRESIGALAPTLRELLTENHDTLASAMNGP